MEAFITQMYVEGWQNIAQQPTKTQSEQKVKVAFKTKILSAISFQH